MMCLSHPQMDAFLALTSLPVRWLNETAFMVTATTHNVIWVWQEFCWAPFIIGSGMSL